MKCANLKLMPSDGLPADQAPLFNSEKFEQLLSFYKFPLILSIIGMVLLVTAIVLLSKNRMEDTSVRFDIESTASGVVKSKIRVDIAGSVINPGVYEFNDGQRVQDALAAAGGLSVSADREWIAKNINRAAKLADGGKIYIPSVNEATEGKIQNSKFKIQNEGGNLLGVTTGLININTATQGQLEELPGVGPVTAGKIIDARPYQTLEELKSKKAVGNALFEKIKDKLTI